MALVTMPTIMPRLSVPTVIIPIIPMIARLTASMDRTGSQAASLLEPGRGFMATGAAIGDGVITGAVGITDAAITDEEATTAGVLQAADVASLAADAVASTADAAVLTEDAVALVADAVALAANEAAAVDSTEVVEAVSMAAVGMVGATDN